MPLTVVIADDVPDIADLLALCLRREKHAVFVGYDGQQAFDLIAQHRPHAAYLDIAMPKMNGREVARYVREQPWGKTMTLVAMSAHVQPADRAAAKLAGFDMYLFKPSEPEPFVMICRELEARLNR